MEFVILEFMNAHHIPAFWKLWALADTVLEVMNFGGYGLGVFDGSPMSQLRLGINYAWSLKFHLPYVYEKIK